MNILAILPILIPVTTAALCLALSRHRNTQHLLSFAGATVLLVASIALLIAVVRQGSFAVQIGNWPAPYGITFVADYLSSIMVAITGVMGFTTSIYSMGEIDPERKASGYYVVFQTLLMGVNGAFLSGDIFNLYVWFEVMVISSFVLLALGREREQIKASWPYVLMNILASTLLLTGVATIYGLTGTLNMAELSLRIHEAKQYGPFNTAAMLFLVAFGIKAAVFPLFFWLPASYHAPPVAVSAIFAGLLTKVGVYAIIRFFTLVFRGEPAFTHGLILVISGLTMLIGVLGAVAQVEFRRILSFHIISQIGYMILGLGLFSPLGVAGSVFYIVHHIIVKSNLFLVSGVVNRTCGSFELSKLGGLYRSSPALSVLFLVPAFSLAGFPPLSGFWGKFALAKAGVMEGQYAIVAIALVVGLLTTISMTKIWAEAFWKPKQLFDATSGHLFHGPIFLMILPTILLASLTLAISLFPEFFFSIAMRASEELLDPSRYITVVLGGHRS